MTLNDSNIFNKREEASVDLFGELKFVKFVNSFIEEMILAGSNKDDVSLLIDLIADLDENYQWSVPKKVLIPKDEIGKFREVFIFCRKDALLLKAINRVFSSKLGHLVSDKVFSYKKGVSVFTACEDVRRALSRMYPREDNPSINYVKADISKYFNSVNHESIKNVIESLVRDESGRKLLLNLYSINSYVDREGKIHEEYLGLMPGTALSSFMANYMLNELDIDLCKRVSHYARYSDDIILVDKSERKLSKALVLLENSLKEFGLELNENKVNLCVDVEFIEFLGLKVNKRHIDVSKKNFSKLKAIVKTVCKHNRKRYEMSMKNGKWADGLYYLKSAIKEINGELYGGYFTKDSLSRNSKLTYLFRNITTVETLVEFDNYIRDQLRYVYTGVHNKANFKKVPHELLVELGYVSCLHLYNVGKISGDVLDFRINRLLNDNPFTFRGFYQPSQAKAMKRFHVNGVSFLGFINSCKNRGFNLYLDGLVYSIEDLEVDFINKKISLDGRVLVENDKYVFIGRFGAYKDGSYYEYTYNGNLYKDELCSEELLLKYYRNTFLATYHVQDVVKYNPYKYFTRVDRVEFYVNGFIDNERLMSPSLFALTFYCYLYNCDKDLVKKEYVILGDKLPLVFESRLIV